MTATPFVISLVATLAAYIRPCRRSVGPRRSLRLLAAILVIVSSGLLQAMSVDAAVAEPSQVQGTALAWGQNILGELGNGTTAGSSVPIRTSGPGGAGVLTGVTQVAAGSGSSLALRADGTVFGWGSNFLGVLGNGTTQDTKVPVQVKGVNGNGVLTGIIAISTKGNHSLALRNDGAVLAWGSNMFGELGNGNAPANSLVPIQVHAPAVTGFLTGVSAISAGIGHSLALRKDGTVLAWGNNTFGQLGIGTINDVSIPVQVKGPNGTGVLTGIVGIAAGAGQSYALRNDGTVFAWGLNNNGQLGIGNQSDSHVPVQVKGAGGAGFLTGITAIAAGTFNGMALTRDGTVFTWGSNLLGQLGTGDMTSSPVPVQVVGPGGDFFLSGIAAISVGQFHCLALTKGGTVFAWGDNGFGQLGNGTTDQSSVPVQVKGVGGSGVLIGVINISAGSSYSLAVQH